MICVYLINLFFKKLEHRIVIILFCNFITILAVIEWDKPLAMLSDKFICQVAGPDGLDVWISTVQRSLFSNSASARARCFLRTLASLIQTRAHSLRQSDWSDI